MSSNRFYTVIVVPEKTSQTRRFTIPSWILKGGAVVFAFFLLLGTLMIFNYWYVMGQISENQDLRTENRRLKQQVQVFQNRMETLENSLERIKTFSARLKVITNLEDRDSLIQSLNEKLPDANTNIGKNASSPSAPPSAPPEALLPKSEHAEAEELLRRDSEKLDQRFSLLHHDSLKLELTLQDQYELLSDQKAFLLALPTRKPTIGYFTSGFGIRKSPYGGRVKMHEGLDIANRPGTPIRATADGIVAFSDGKPGYGQTVIVDHGYGIETWYGHAKRLLVRRGQKIKRGEQVALLGSSGRSTGPHLHYEVRVNGTPVDPLSYLLENE